MPGMGAGVARRPVRRLGWRGLGSVLLLAGAAVVVFLFVLFARGQRAEVEAIWRGRLSAMAADRQAAIERWLAGRREDARMIAGFPSVRALAAPAAGAPAAGAPAGGLGPHIAEVLGDFIREREYTEAALVAGSGAVLAQGGGEPLPDDAVAQARRAVAGAAGPQFFIRGRAGTPVLLTMQPLGVRPPYGGVVLLFSDPERWIFRLLAMEPIPTATGESLLVQREGDRLVYVSPLRLSAARPLTRWVTDPRQDPAAWLATSGKVTFGRFTDYRGVEVLAATRPVPATGWGLVVKVDEREAMAPWRRAVTLGALAGVLALGALAALLAAFLSRRRVVELAETLQERELYEEKLRRLGRLYRTLSEVNQLLVREQDEAAMLAGVCRIVVGEGGYQMAWVAAKENDGSLRMVSSAGEAAAYLEGASIRWDDTPEGRGPTGTAVRENRPVVNNDTLANPALDAWRERVDSAGYRSSAAFPVPVGGDVVGALTVYESEPDAFDEERLRLLAELASDIGYSLGAMRERAARQAAELALRESEQRFALFMRHLPGVAVMRDREGRYLFMNEAWEEAMQLDRADLLGKTPMECFPEASAQELLSGDREVVRTGEPLTHVVPLQHRDGVRYWLTHHFPIAGPDGAIAAVGILYVDISDRIRAEEGLRESEATFKTLAESAHAAIFVYRGVEFVYVNQEVARLTGYTANELLGRSVLSVVHPDDLAMVRANLESRVRGGHPPPRYEFRIVDKTGMMRWIDFTAAACLFRGEMAVLCTAYEVTERKAAEVERARLAAAIEQSGEAVVLTDPDGTIRYVNPAFTRITGYSAAEAIGRTPAVLKSGLQSEAFYRELWTTITAGKTWEGRIVNRRKDGSLYTEEMTISAVRDAAGAIIQFVAVKRDITAHLDMEAQLLQAQKMEAVGLLAGGVAHDFNNLLQAMLAVVALARSDRSSTERAFARLEELEGQIRRGGALMRQLLLFARRETTRPETFDLNELVRDVTRMLGRLVRENITLSSRLEDVVLPVDADRSQIEQVLVNLVVNASDAMPDGGRIEISTWGRPDLVGLAVADDGPGIPAAIRSRIFEPFFTTKGPGKGTGLGLSVVHGIVTRFAGRVEVASEEGSGATFTVTLPRAAGPLRTAPPSTLTTAPEAGHGERILIVEDEAAAREALGEILTSLGYVVVGVGSGREADARPAQPGFDLLLTDLVLPDVSGLDLAVRLKERWPRMELVLMSGYSDNDAVREAVTKGRARFLQKPFGLDTLARELRDALDR